MNTQNVRTLSTQESRLLNALSAAGKAVFTVEDAQAAANGQGANLPRLLSGLTRKRWLLRLERGKYLILPLSAGMEGLYTAHEFVLASRLVEPYAIAYWSALHYHGFTEQMPHMVTVVSPARRRDVVIPNLGFRCHFVTVAPERFFGHSTVLIDDLPVVVTDPARTVVDCLDRPDLCGGIVEATKGLVGYARRADAQPARLAEYATRLGNQAIVKRLGYLAEQLDLPARFRDAGWSAVMADWQRGLSAGFARLDPRLQAVGPYDRAWRLRLNVKPEQLLGWMES